MAIGPTCPQCATRIAFRRTQWGLGKPFNCAGCGALIVLPKTYLWLGAFVVYVLLRNWVPPSVGKLPLLAFLLLATLLVEQLLRKAKLAPTP